MALPILGLLGLGMSAAGQVSNIMGAQAAGERLRKAQNEQRKAMAQAAQQARLDAIQTAGTVPTGNAALGRRQALQAANQAGARTTQAMAPAAASADLQLNKARAEQSVATGEAVGKLFMGLGESATQKGAFDVATEPALTDAEQQTAAAAPSTGKMTGMQDPTGLSGLGGMAGTLPPTNPLSSNPQPSAPSGDGLPVPDVGLTPPGMIAEDEEERRRKQMIANRPALGSLLGMRY